MTRFTAAYSVDTDDEDEVLDVIDEIVDGSGDNPFFVAFSSIEGSSIIIVSTELPVDCIDDVSPTPLIVALSEAERYGDDALWIEPTSHTEAVKEIERIIEECTVDEALNSPLSIRAKRATEAIKRLVSSPPTREEGKGPKPPQKPIKSAKKASSPDTIGEKEQRKARPMPGKQKSDSSKDMASVKAKARDRLDREITEVDNIMDEWTV